MGCSTNVTVHTYTVSYCSLNQIPNKPNLFMIEQIAEEEIEKVEGAKFLDQCGQNQEIEIKNFLERDKFKTNTIFYIFLRKEPIIRNYSQSINYQPFHLTNLFRIILLATEKANSFPNTIIEKKTQDLTYYDYNKKIINFEDMKEKLDQANNPNISNDNISLDDVEVIYEDGDEINEKDNEIIVCEDINKDSLDYIMNKYKDGNNIINSIKVFTSKIDKLSIFVKIMKFLEDKNIKKFSFYDNNTSVDFEGWDSISEFLEYDYAIRYVDLHNSNINDNQLSIIIRSLSDKRIRLLNLSKNLITIEGAKTISDFLKNNKTLLRLNLSYNSKNHFKAEAIKIIMDSLNGNPNIQLIDFSEMQLTGCGECIGKFINKSESIQSVILKNVRLNAIDFKNIFENIKNNKSIKEINISMNDMGGEKGLQYIAEAIKENKSLETIRMDKININNENYKVIFDAIEKNKKISTYSVSYNSNIKPKTMLDFFIKQMHVKTLHYEPFNKNSNEDRNKELTLEEKKLFEKFKSERPDMKIIYK